MKPRNLRVGEKYFWFGRDQTDVLQYKRKCKKLDEHYGYGQYGFDTYQFVVIASTSKWESFGQDTDLDLAAVGVTFPYDSLWQFCSLFFDFRRKTKLYKLKVP